MHSWKFYSFLRDQNLEKWVKYIKILIIINRRFYLLTEIFRQPTKIETFNRLPTKMENFNWLPTKLLNFNRQPTSGPPHSDPLVTVTFFTRPDLLPLQNQLYLCLQSKNHIAVITHQSEQTCALILTFSEIEGQQAYSGSFFCCSSNSNQSFFFFTFHYIVLFSSALWKFLFFIRITFCTQIVLFTRCEVENDNCRQWLQNNWLFSRKQFLQLDLTEASKTNNFCNFLYFLMIGWV